MEFNETTLEVPYSTDLKCPACEGSIPVTAIVKVEPGSVRHVGSSGFRKPNFSVDMKTEILRFEIKHSCLVRSKEN